MQLGTKEHHEMMAFFEEKIAQGRTDREPVEMWRKGYFYQSGEVNAAFMVFQHGVAYGRLAYA